MAAAGTVNPTSGSSVKRGKRAGSPPADAGFRRVAVRAREAKTPGFLTRICVLPVKVDPYILLVCCHGRYLRHGRRR